MQTYEMRSRQVALDSSIAVIVLLNSDNTDMEFWPLTPRQATESELTSPEEFTARKLRSVGVVAMNGCGLPQAAFKEPLDSSVVSAIASGFTEYLRVLIGHSFAEQIATAEIAELERWNALPDSRPN